MSRLPFRLNENWDSAREQVEELIRILYEERIGGLKVGSDLSISGDALTVLASKWTRHAVGIIARAMDADSGNVSYTGVGFTPSAVLLLGSSSDGGLSVGLDDGTTKGCIYWYAASTTFASAATVSIAIVDKDGGSQSALVKSMDSDGFTLTWTKDSSPGTQDGKVYYLAVR